MSFRFERRGEIKPLTPRFMHFLREALSGVCLDDVQDPSETRPDFSCLNDLLVLEIKTLEEDASVRVGNVVEELREREDWPEFYGAWPMESVMQHMDEPESVRRKLLDRTGRAIVSHLKKANKQLAAHSVKNPRLSQVRVVVLINEDHEDYDPRTITFIIQKALARLNGEVPLYESIDAVFFLTERHATRDGNNIAFPMIMITGRGMEQFPWKGDVLDYLSWKWAQWTGARHVINDPEDAAAVINSFSTIDHIPEQMSRQEAWRLAYRRNPYMRSWTYEELRDHWDNIQIVNIFAFIKDSPLKPAKEAIAKSMEKFSHLQEEIAHRALSLEKFKAENSRVMNAAMRMNIQPLGLEWLAGFLRGGRL